MRPDVTQVKPVYNPPMTVFRYGREHFEEGEYVRRVDAMPGDDIDPVVRIVEDLGMRPWWLPASSRARTR